jgi:hypothetical protein
MSGMLLVAHQYMPDPGSLFVEFIINKQNCAAGITENGIHTLFDEAFYKDA